MERSHPSFGPYSCISSLIQFFVIDIGIVECFFFLILRPLFITLIERQALDNLWEIQKF
jgi:hypothetical protein